MKRTAKSKKSSSGTGETPLAQVDSTLSSLAPEQFFAPRPEFATQLAELTKELYAVGKSNEKQTLGPLPSLFVEGFSSDQIWEMLQTRNEPVLDYVTSNLADLKKGPSTEELNEDEESEEDEDADAEEDVATLEDIDADEEEEAAATAASKTKAKAGKPTKSKAATEGEEDDAEPLADEETLRRTGGGQLTDDNPFFDLEEMNAVGGLEDSDPEEDFDEEKAAGHADEDPYGEEINLDEEEDDEDDDAPRDPSGIKFADFFGPAPKTKAAGKSKAGAKVATSAKKSKTAAAEDVEGEAGLDDDDADLEERLSRMAAEEDGFEDYENDDEFVEEDNDEAMQAGAGEDDEEGAEGKGRKGKRAKEDDDSGFGSGAAPVSGKEGAHGQNLSGFEAAQLAMREKIKQLEQQLVKPRAWDLSGEATAFQRPVDSLLEHPPEFDYVGKIAPAITPEFTQDLESLIKRRIIDEAWDDPERKAPPVAESEYVPKEDVSDQQSELGLAGEIEKQMLAKARSELGDGGSEAKDKLTEKHQAIQKLFQSLCYKLDALSNFQFTPKPVSDEIKPKALSVASIALEETTPMAAAVSDTTQKAPEEVYRSEGRGAPVARSELTREEKHAKRQGKKEKFKKKQAEKEQKVKEQEKKREAMGLTPKRTKIDLQAKGLHKGKGGDVTKYAKSSEVFAKIQAAVTAGAVPQPPAEETTAKKKSASRVKL